MDDDRWPKEKREKLTLCIYNNTFSVLLYQMFYIYLFGLFYFICFSFCIKFNLF